MSKSENLDTVYGGIAILVPVAAYFYGYSFWECVGIFFSLIIIILTISNFFSYLSGKASEKKMSKYIDKLGIREKLVLSLVQKNPNHSKLIDKYHDLVNKDFMNFYYKVGIKEPLAIEQLNQIENEIKKIDSFPQFLGKRIVAVGGGFSAGKSQFLINLLKDEKLSLPTSTDPTTAIPTYVMHDEKSALYGVGEKGNMINLTDFDPEIGKKLNHDFIQAFGFNLKHIMPYMVMTNQLAYENICFIDTPGYNPSSSDDSYTKEDRKEAKKFIQSADSLIWLIPINTGTVSKKDLDFLEEVLLEDQKLYIVLNKADHLDSNSLNKVLDEVETRLNDNQIDYEGISVYSSKDKKEYFFKEKSLNSFLIENNFNSFETNKMIDNAQKLISDRLNEIKCKQEEFKHKLVEIRNVLASDFKSNHEDIVDELIEQCDDVDHEAELKEIMDKLRKTIKDLYLSYKDSNKK